MGRDLRKFVGVHDMKSRVTFLPLSLVGAEVNITVESSVLCTFDGHRQRRCWSREAGGQLFARVKGKNWKVSLATGPRNSDVRGRFNFQPHREAEQAEIFEQYAQGLEFVGEWHTHPESMPQPSRSDITSLKNIVRESTHHFPGFMMCIVGQSPFPDGLWISFHNVSGKWTRLKIKDTA